MTNEIVVSEAKTASPLIQQKPGAFVGEFDYTLSPYSGCQFGCSYCYVPDVLRGLPEKRGGWGTYVDTRSRSVSVLQKHAESLQNASIFMSATTDAYQPVEAQKRITRGLLEALVDIPFDFLLISTRSGLVLRDLDILTDPRMINRVEVGISIPTDLEEAHRVLEPRTASFKGRFVVARKLREAGVATRIHAAPIARLSTESFVASCRESADWLWVDGAGHGAGRTKEGQEWLYDYPSAHAWAGLFAYRLGKTRVGYGREQFAWRWDRVVEGIVPPVSHTEVRS